MQNAPTCANCLEFLPQVPDHSIDLILTDLPYQVSDLGWDTIIPFAPLWEQYKRIIKPSGAIVLTAAQPFTSMLVMSNLKMFKYAWIWKKTRKTGFPNANRQPLRNYEDVLVFYDKQCTYNPQGLVKREIPKIINRQKPTRDTVNAGENDGSLCKEYKQEYENYPSQVLEIASEGKTIHGTQKPLKLFEYLISTYTHPGQTVLDSCAGSFTTAVACDNLGRNWICIEMDEQYCQAGKERINSNRLRLNLPPV